MAMHTEEEANAMGCDAVRQRSREIGKQGAE